jgi:hypothetical protein
LSGVVVSSAVHLSDSERAGRMHCDVLSARVGDCVASLVGGRRVAVIEWEAHRKF